MRSTINNPGIYEKCLNFIYNNNYIDEVIIIIGWIITGISILFMILSMTNVTIPIEVIYMATVIGIPNIFIFCWGAFGFEMLNAIIKYGTVDEISLEHTKFDPDYHKRGGEGLWIVTVLITSFVAFTPVLVYHAWFVMAPILAVVAIGCGMVYTSRKVFTLKKRLNQHVVDPNAHKNIGEK